MSTSSQYNDILRYAPIRIQFMINLLKLPYNQSRTHANILNSIGYGLDFHQGLKMYRKSKKAMATGTFPEYPSDSDLELCIWAGKIIDIRSSSHTRSMSQPVNKFWQPSRCHQHRPMGRAYRDPRRRHGQCKRVWLYSGYSRRNGRGWSTCTSHTTSLGGSVRTSSFVLTH